MTNFTAAIMTAIAAGVTFALAVTSTVPWTFLLYPMFFLNVALCAFNIGIALKK